MDGAMRSELAESKYVRRVLATELEAQLRTRTHMQQGLKQNEVLKYLIHCVTAYDLGRAHSSHASSDHVSRAFIHYCGLA